MSIITDAYVAFLLHMCIVYLKFLGVLDAGNTVNVDFFRSDCLHNLLLCSKQHICIVNKLQSNENNWGKYTKTNKKLPLRLGNNRDRLLESESSESGQ